MKKINLRVKSILDGYTIDNMNKGLDKDNLIHENQIDAAKEMILKWSVEDSCENTDNSRCRHLIFKAQMQSGKTGGVCANINLLHETTLEKYFGIKKYFILTGMNDVGLGTQTLERVKKQVHFANDLNVDNGKNNDTYECEDCRIVVMRNSVIRKSTHILENCVVYIDESHYGSGEQSVLTKFFERSGIDWKNKSELVEKNIYIVSVSATPFVETHSDLSDVKEDVVLKVTENYYGISEFYRSGQILAANGNYDFKRNGKNEYPIVEYIKDAYDRMEENGNGDKVGLIFVRAYKAKPNVVKNNQFIRDNFKIVELTTQGGKQIDYNRVHEELKMMHSTYGDDRVKPVLFLVKGAFRAGITINMKDKDYIYMIYDNSSEMAATYQGLAGRLSGYRFSDDDKINRATLYLNMDHVEKYDKWVDGDLNRIVTPGVTGYVTTNDTSHFNDSTDKWGGEKIGVFNLPLCDMDYKTITSLSDKSPKEKKEIIFGITKDLLNSLNIDVSFIGEIYINSGYKQSVIDRFGGNNNSVPTLRISASNFTDVTGRKDFCVEDINKKYSHVFINHNTKEIIMSVGTVSRFRKITHAGKYFKPHMNTNLSENLI